MISHSSKNLHFGGDFFQDNRLHSFGESIWQILWVCRVVLQFLGDRVIKLTTDWLAAVDKTFAENSYMQSSVRKKGFAISLLENLNLPLILVSKQSEF